MKNELKRLMGLFPKSYINGANELILVPKFNKYFRLEDVKTSNQLYAKVISWISREASNSTVYSAEWRNLKYCEEMRMKLNQFLNVNFNNIQWDYIYCKLGNNCNPELRDKFIDSGFDFNVFDQEDFQKNWNLLVVERKRAVYE